MKLRVTLKDPDGFYVAANDYAKSKVRLITDLTDSERSKLIESRTNEALAELRSWVDCDEYIDIDFDTEAKTATVVT